MQKIQLELKDKVIKKETLANLLPGVVAALSQGIDLQLLFTLSGWDPDMVAEVMQKLQDYLSSS